MRTAPLLASLVLAALGATSLGCPKNEAVVCGSSTGKAGGSCSATYELCAGGSDRIDCKPSGGGVSCACVESGVTTKTFQSDDACDVSPDTLKKRAIEGCGWKDLDEE